MKQCTRTCGTCSQDRDASLFRGRSKRCLACDAEVESAYKERRKLLINQHVGPFLCIHCEETFSREDISSITKVGGGVCRVCNGFKHIQNSARARNITAILTMDEYRILVGGNGCHYCGFPLPRKGGGLDRKDSSLGYSKENCLPCCNICNTAKNDNFSVTEMMRIGAVIREIRLERESDSEAA